MVRVIHFATPKAIGGLAGAVFCGLVVWAASCVSLCPTAQAQVGQGEAAPAAAPAMNARAQEGAQQAVGWSQSSHDTNDSQDATPFIWLVFVVAGLGAIPFFLRKGRAGRTLVNWKNHEGSQ